MLCKNCVHVIIIQKPSDELWETPSNTYITECKNKESVLNQNIYGIFYLAYLSKCSLYTPKVNLKNRITDINWLPRYL